jgi:hypothetical protein
MNATAEVGSKVESKMPRLNPPAPNGSRLPIGRPKGTLNKATRTIKEAIEAACQPGQCHPKGLAGWLVERAQGGVQDRQIFATFIAKAIPAQLQTKVEGGIVVALPWLQGRNIGQRVPSASHLDVIDAQVIDAQGQTGEDLRVDDPTRALEAPAAADPTPHPPSNPEPGVG